MTAPESRLRIGKKDEVMTIEFIDRNILDEANIAQISEEIGNLIDDESLPKFLIDFSNVDHLSSAALGALITINNKIKAKDGQLRLSNINDQIIEVFEITRLDRLFQIHKTVDEAMETYS